MNTGISRRILFVGLLTTMVLALATCSTRNNTSTPEIKIQESISGLFDIIAGAELYEDLNILYSCEGTNGEFGRIKSAVVYGSIHENPYIPLLIVMNNDTPLLFKLEACGTPFPIVYLQDIDGDGEDEIIIDSIKRASHFVESVLYVLKIVEDKLEVLYRFPSHSYSEDEELHNEMNNFGFTSQLMENDQLLIEYPSLKFHKIFDISHHYNKSLYSDSEGGIPPSVETIGVVYFDSVLVSDIQDIDEDGSYEIIGVQTARMLGQVDLGVAKITLKYNHQSKGLEAVSVDFELIPCSRPPGRAGV